MADDVTQMREYIWGRQYAKYPGETLDEGLQRVARAVAKTDKDYRTYLNVMRRFDFVPGGRILAGAGSNHGNLLNCYVLAPDPETAYGETAQTLDLSLRLAKVTKVGGGVGLNLDYLPPAGDHGGVAPDYYPVVTIDRAHPDYEEVMRVLEDQDVWVDTEARSEWWGHHPKSVHPHYVEDSIEGIWLAAGYLVEAVLSGNPIVLDVSNLRPAGSVVTGSGGTSSGPASFVREIFSNFTRWASLGGFRAGPVATLRYVFAPTLRVIKQGGTRRGAGMATLSATHADIIDFITCKDRDRERNEGPIDTFNISVLLTDEDMENDELVRNISSHAWETGEPGAIFIDVVNGNNALAEIDGSIKATNPCGEIPLYPNEPCNLGAINVANCVAYNGKDWVIDEGYLEALTRIAIRFLDDVLDVTVEPLPEIKDAILDKRRLGLGIMGLGDALIRLGAKYNTDAAINWAGRIATIIAKAATEETTRLGEERGVPSGVRRAMQHYTALTPRRNIAYLTVAPTGTTSLLAGVSSGIEPVFSATISRRIGDETKTYSHPLAKHPAFVTAHELSWEAHVDMQATVQSMFDLNTTFGANSISKTINLPHNATREDAYGAFIEAHAGECKGITVYRDGSRDGQVLTPVEVTSEPESQVHVEVPDDAIMDAINTGLQRAANDAAAAMLYTHRKYGMGYEVDLDAIAADEARRAAEAVRRPTRPTRAEGVTYKYDVGGRKVYIVVNKDDDDNVVEVFIVLGRPTDAEKVAADVIGRLISTALKFGAPTEAIVKHLSGHMDKSGGFVPGWGFAHSLWDVVADAIRDETTKDDANPLQLSKAVGETQQDPCPDCGADLVHEEGCAKCHTCGYASCG